jgi:predicted nucleic acid-binding protein
MAELQFVDTNVLLYAISTAPDEAAKAREARRLLDGEDLAISVQVLQNPFRKR